MDSEQSNAQLMLLKIEWLFFRNLIFFLKLRDIKFVHEAYFYLFFIFNFFF